MSNGADAIGLREKHWVSGEVCLLWVIVSVDRLIHPVL